MAYVLPSRKAFSDAVTRTFLKYRDKSADLSRKGFELFTYQKMVRDYLLIETPYRGLLFYHGLGSGKTCSSIAVAESLMSTNKVYVLTPASLRENYLQEIRRCGDPVYAIDQHWEMRIVRTDEDKKQALGMGISESYLDKHLRYFVTIPGVEANFRALPREQQQGIDEQIDDVIHQRFNFINYNGISTQNVDKILPPDQPELFHNSVIIIEEAHNLIGSVVNERGIKQKLYDMLYHAKNTKIVCLSGTPIINRPQEIAFLMNLLRGPIERISIPTKSAISWDEGLMTTFFRALKDVDTIEYNSVKRTIMLTRNPPYFESVYSEKGERIAVKYNKEFEQEKDIKKWVESWRAKFQIQFAGVELVDKPEHMFVEELECLPTDYEQFMNTFVDGLSIKNAMLFQRRIQGLVSFFKGADESLLPKRLEEENTLQKISMSDAQFLRYLEERHEEIRKESRKSRMKADLNENLGSFRIATRLICDYSVPSELKTITPEGETEETTVEKPEILKKLKENPAKYLSEEGLKVYSPKMLQMLKDMKESIGEPGKFRNQLVYSQHKTLEGLGIFGAILEANGFQQYKLVKRQGIWEEDPSMKKGVPSYGLYTGEQSDEERGLYLQIFNEKYLDSFPQSLKDSITEHRLCVFMISSAGAEGITTANVRDVYVMEPHWNPSRIDQVIGRAIRIGSHSTLPAEERNVRVRMYITVFSDQQKTTNEGPNIVSIRRNDMVLKRYEGTEPFPSFMSSDEFLYEVSYEKGRIIKNVTHLLKQSAIDCELHRKLHTREQPVVQCLRFDTTAGPEDLAYKPNYKTEETDTLYKRNVTRRTRKLQLIRVKGNLMILDPDTNELFDASAFQDTQRLLRLGTLTKPGEIRFFTSVVS